MPDLATVKKNTKSLDSVTNFKVTKSNELVEAGFKLSLNEQRLLLIAISQIDSRRPRPGKANHFVIRADEFAKLFNIDMKNAYTSLSDASDRLYDRDVKTYDKNNHVKERFRWVYHIKYYDNKGYVELAFSPNSITHLTGLSQRFTTYELKQITELRTQYSIRIYELLKRFINHPKKEFIIDIEKFRTRLDLDDMYPRFFDLNKRIIAPAIKEINKHTDIAVSLETKRKGRKIQSLKFNIDNNQQRQLPILDEKYMKK